MASQSNLNYGICYGAEAFFTARLLNKNKQNFVLIVENHEIDQIVAELNLFLADSINYDILPFPAWDSNFYDRISPSYKLQQQRIRTINSLGVGSKKQTIIVTSPEALASKSISYEDILDHKIHFKIGGKCDFSSLQRTFVELGYNRTPSVCDYSEFAIRGSIIDICDNQTGNGIRLDFFGDIIESIKFFELASQKTFASIEEITIFQASEVVLNKKSKKIFLEKYKKLNSSYTKSSLFDAVMNDHYFAGWENWVSLFYSELGSIFDYLDQYKIISANNINLKINNLYEAINSAYQTRIQQAEQFQEEYFPVPPQSMWLTEAELNISLSKETIYYSYFSERPEFKNIIVENILAIEQIASNLIKLAKEKKQKLIFFSENDAIIEILQKYHPTKLTYFLPDSKNNVFLIDKTLRASFENQEYLFVSDDILLKNKQSKHKKTIDLEKLWDEASGLKDGDYVVHKLHGIGIFQGIHNLMISGSSYDCVKLLFADNDILYLPVIGLDLIKKYKSEDGATVKLDKLGSVSWQIRKAKIKNRIKEIAIELLKIAAIRETKEGRIFVPELDSYHKLCNDFSYTETPDQFEAINAVLEDLSRGRPMDRLICGDVGFGKTEVAIRAAFAVVKSADKAQVAIVAPTTLLVRQHYQTLQKRFGGYGIKIAQISRFVKPAEIKRIKMQLEYGEIDIVVGTHALLAKDIKFFDLGLLIVDEEQHFGVKQKESLKQLKTDCHVLTLSATPIPRTLQMSIVGIKELSLIATPPVDRMAIKTIVVQEDYHLIVEAINKELQRGGSVFFVSPRISFLTEIKEKLDKYLPGNKSRIAHGQMPPQQIEDTMIDFFNRKFDIWLSTSIIESGIDLPFVNTIIIHRSDMFGLAALYQLRGRVGRSKIKAYAYFLLPKTKLNKTSFQRLEVMQSLDNLGVGFSIASSDMDIRGFGNLLGEEQSGHVREVGVELYQDMLSQAIHELKTGSMEEEDFNPAINLGFTMLIPDKYIGDAATKLSIYKKAGKLKELDEVFDFKMELIDRFGKIPMEVKNFLILLQFKVQCKKLSIDKIDVSEKAILIGFKDNKFANPDSLLEYIKQNAGHIKIRTDHKLVLTRHYAKQEDRINYLQKTLEDLYNFIN